MKATVMRNAHIAIYTIAAIYNHRIAGNIIATPPILKHIQLFNIIYISLVTRMNKRVYRTIDIFTTIFEINTF